MITKQFSNSLVVVIYGLAHFFVDFACAVMIFRIFELLPEDAMAVALTYNFFAFAGQFPIGAIADRVKNNALLAGLGCFLVLVAIPMVLSNELGLLFLVCIVAGVGNALFHIGGGADVLAISRGRASLSGVYVATGALGLFLGGAFCWELLAVMIAIFAMALLAFGFVAFRKWFSVRRLEMAKRSHHVGKSIGEEVVFSKGVIVAIICLLLTICMRSYLGMIMRFPWKDSFVISFIFVAMVMLGKMAGGVVGDYFGWRRTAVVSLIISAMLFGFGFDNSVCGIAGVFLFNFTMPITLVALANLFPHHYGLVFGATTLALFVGALPVLLGLGGSMFNPFGLGISIFVSALVLGVGLTLYYRIQSDG